MPKKSIGKPDNSEDRTTIAVQDEALLKSWRSIILKGLVPETKQWYSIRNLRGTGYGRVLFRGLMTFLSEEQNFDVMLDLVRRWPGIVHPEMGLVDDRSDSLKDLTFVCDDSLVFHKHESPLQRFKWQDSIPGEMRSYGVDESIDATSQMDVETLTKLHALDMAERRVGGKIRVVGMRPDGDDAVVEIRPDEDRGEVTPEQMMFIEDNYPILLMRDIALHSMITGDEVLIEVINEDWIPDPSEINSDSGVEVVSSLDCSWLLSETERVVACFMRTVYRSVAYGFYNEMTQKSPDTFSDDYWDALWEEASTEHDIILKIMDKTRPWGSTPGVRTISMSESIAPEEIEVSAMRLNMENGLTGDTDANDLKDLLTALLLKTNHHDFDLNNRRLNEITRFFEMTTYSVVMNSHSALEESIDPLVPPPDRVFDMKMSECLKEFETAVSGMIAQDDVRLQYLGRRKSDGRLAFVYVDGDGHTVTPESLVRITMGG